MFAKKIVSIVCAVSLLGQFDLSAAYGEGSSPLKKWNIILPNDEFLFWGEEDNCFVFLAKAEKKKKACCDDLNKLFDKLLSAAVSGDRKAYLSCFDSEKALKDEKLKKDMADWKGYNSAWKIRKCAWGIRRTGNLYFIVAATTKAKSSGPNFKNVNTLSKYGISHIRHIFYAIKKENEFKFISGTRDKRLEKIIQTEIYPSLAVYECRPKEEIKLSAEYEKYLKKKRQGKDTNWRFNAYFDDDEEFGNKRYFIKLGYKKKDFAKLFDELEKYENEFNQNLPKSKNDHWGLKSDIMSVKYAISKGHIKIFKKPVLITGFEKKENLDLKPDANPFDYLFACQHSGYVYGQKFNLYKKFRLDRCQVFAYGIRKFRNYKFLDLWAVGYSSALDKNRVWFDHYDNFVYDNKQKIWRQLQYPIYKNVIDQEKLLKLPEEAYLIRNQLPVYLTDLDRVITTDPKDIMPKMNKQEYSERLKSCGFFDAFYIRKDEECTPYTTGLDFLKLPTVDPKTFKFPELEADDNP